MNFRRCHQYTQDVYRYTKIKHKKYIDPASQAKQQKKTTPKHLYTRAKSWGIKALGHEPIFHNP